MSGGGPRPADPPGGAPDDDRLARLAARLGVELPPFPGPLVAFDPADERSPGDQIYLGGDLHAVHPETSAAPRDPSLDAATIALTDFEHETLEATAVEGVWCLALQGPLFDSVPYFTISDTEGRLRTWIVLPPVRLMIGLVHLWLPAVAPAARTASKGRPGPRR